MLLFSCPVMSDSLHGLQHVRLLCPLLSPRVCSDSCPLSWWWPSSHLNLCHPLFLLPSIFPSIRVFSNESALPVRWSQYWSFSFSMNIQDWFPLGLTDLISLQSKGFSTLFSKTAVKKQSILQHLAFFMVSNQYMTTGKTIALTRQTFVGKVMSLLFNMLSRLIIAFLPRRKHLLISWLQSPLAVILESPPKIKSDTLF